MADGTRVDGLDALSAPLARDDRMIIGRGGVAYRADMSDLRGGLLYPRKQIVKPTATDFATWVNQGTATLVDVGDALSLQQYTAGSTTNFIGREHDIPTGGDWWVEIGARKHWRSQNYLIGGIYIRDSSSGRIEYLAHGHGSTNVGLLAGKFNSPTSYNNDRRGSFEYSDNFFFRMHGAGAAFTPYYSYDGELWIQYDVQISAGDFLPAADKWGFFIQPTNITNTRGMRMDVFHWAAGIGLDPDPLPSYRNSSGMGDRTALITVSSNATYHAPSSPPGILGLVDGSFLNGNSPWFDPPGQTGIYIDFAFPNAKIVTEVKHYASSATGHGTWKWQGSNDGITYTDISASFSFAGSSAGALVGDLAGNNGAYAHYRLTQTAGFASDDPFLREFEFKLYTG